MSDLHSVKAPDETPNEPKPTAHTFRVLRRDDDDEMCWHEEGTIDGPEYGPRVHDVGEAYGEGTYMLLERDSRYSFLSTYEMRVVAEKRYRLADEDA